jgi:hypothetical protein
LKLFQKSGAKAATGGGWFQDGCGQNAVSASARIASAIAGKTFSPANCHAMSRIKSKTATPAGMDRPASDPAEWPGSMADKAPSDSAFVTVHLNLISTSSE